MKILKAGPLEVRYESGFLRRFTYGDAEILRMVYFALRDHNWDTLNSHIENEHISVEKDRFEISYDCLHVDGGVTVMTWKGTIRGEADGVVTFEIEGTAKEDFRKNRAGFCVLHPLNVSGEECMITHPDGSHQTLVFPRAIAADNPFKNVQAMEWTTAGASFQIEFEGDTFETEDQRNWGDASYKTFCTPLEKPFPVELKRGATVRQRILFRPLEPLSAAAARPSYIMLTEEAGATRKLPDIGIAASTESHALSAAAIAKLREIRFRHYRIDVYPGRENWVTAFSKGYENSYSLGLPLEVALHLTDNYMEEVDAFVVLCQQNRVKLRNVLLLSADGLVTSQAMIEQIPQMKTALPGVLFGAGTNYNFNEINKNLFQATLADFISFSADPQEHAFDDLTILENSSALEHLVASTRAIYGQYKPVHVSSLTLRKRFNPYATNPADVQIDESRKADPRQKEALATLWMFGSICSLARAGTESATYFQTVGDQGILSHEGLPYPVYETLRNFAAFQGKPATILKSGDPLALQAIALDGKVLALANLTDVEQKARWNEAEFTVAPREIRFESLNRA